jgi:hypothetical protein
MQTTIKKVFGNKVRIEWVGSKATGHPDVYIVRNENGLIIGMLEKYRNTRTETHPWKAFQSFGAQREFLGAFYAADGGQKAALAKIWVAQLA